MDSQTLDGFQPQTIEKVKRLFYLLEEIAHHPNLESRLAMFGGTAINLFMLNIPRLSVDIDLSYIGEINREGMLAERPTIEQGIVEVARSQGYSVSGKEGGHAGRTFILGYRSAYGPDQLKIDCIYMNRCPLLPIEARSSFLEPSITFPTFSDAELIGGKVKAFYDRVKVRDLYDIWKLNALLKASSNGDFVLVHQLALFYASLSASFPFGFEERPKRFLDKQGELKEQLYPMLRRTDSRPTMDSLIAEANSFIEEFVLPHSASEEEYLERFSKGEFLPELIFGEGEIADRARMNPEALWKLQNIKQITKA